MYIKQKLDPESYGAFYLSIARFLFRTIREKNRWCELCDLGFSIFVFVCFLWYTYNDGFQTEKHLSPTEQFEFFLKARLRKKKTAVFHVF